MTVRNMVLLSLARGIYSSAMSVSLIGIVCLSICFPPVSDTGFKQMAIDDKAVLKDRLAV